MNYVETEGLHWGAVILKYEDVILLTGHYSAILIILNQLTHT